MTVAKHAGTRLTLCLAALLLGAASVQANNLTISNVLVTGQDTANDFILLQFDITWDNSWRVTSAGPNTPTNWDAAWVFMKYQVAGGAWQHATLNTSVSTLASTLAFIIDRPSDGRGVFVYRSTDGTGPVSFTGVQLVWDYGKDGLSDDEPDVEVQVLGIEMVYVPEGAFAAGSGGSESAAFTLTTINTADATVEPTGIGSLGGEAGGYPTGQIAPNASWPNGFAAFYIQKYEISQGQYAEFLNLLTMTQAGNRFPDENGSARHTISSDGGSPPTYTAGAPDRACNFINWAGGAAYADWAGLRPMTELEYEKASRGTRPPVADEFAWGTTNLHTLTYTITVSTDGTPDETVSNPGSGTGNAHHISTRGPSGPLRVGIFAASFDPLSPTREEAGATFYGVMEMSGNLLEIPVTIGRPEGRLFEGTHGDGVLTTTPPFGDANADTWPGSNAVGVGFRGGAWGSVLSILRVSARNIAATQVAGRSFVFGFRAVRSAP